MGSCVDVAAGSCAPVWACGYDLDARFGREGLNGVPAVDEVVVCLVDERECASLGWAFGIGFGWSRRLSVQVEVGDAQVLQEVGEVCKAAEVAT